MTGGAGCFALAFAAGAALLQLQPGLPPLAWAAVLLAGVLRPRALLVPAAFGAGFFWAAFCAHQRMDDRLAAPLEGRDLRVVGVVSQLPAVGERGVRFELEIESSPAGERLPRKVLLSWHRSPLVEEGSAPLAAMVHPGERWLLTVRLKRPHGSVNPNGFDYEAWLLERGVGATGYVRARPAPQRLGERRSVADRIELAREAVRERFYGRLGATPAAGILTALAVGDQRAIPAEEWRLFARTGVTHLMSISGLHVTLVSGLFAWLVSALWRRCAPLALRLPARKAAALAAVAAALVYTLLAGFAVPAQRTFYMVSVVAFALWTGGIASPLRVLALAAAVVTVFDPWAALAPGTWLSFGAVLLIFYAVGAWTATAWKIGDGARPGVRAPSPIFAWVASWARVQWAVTLGLAPAAVFLFGQVSIAGPVANAVAIPVVSGVVTPLALAAALLPVEALAEAAGWLVERMLVFLEWCAALPAAVWEQHTPPAWTIVPALAGAAWLLAPRGVPSRAAGVALMAPALAVMPARPAEGEAWVTTLDVGQGLAILVRTKDRALLYDAGPSYGPEADSGGRVVLPVLRSLGIARLDALVLTHEDLDHLGGALTVLESIPVERLSSSLPSAHPLHALGAAVRPCRAGETWHWNGVRFEFLHPAAELPSARRNDRSCVLRVAAHGGAAMLLTGDIERAAEAALVSRPAGLRAEVLLVPHHGSRTSSSPEFVAAVEPRWAIAAAGYRSRFGHPNPDVLERYRSAGARVLRTDLDGAVHVRLGPQVEVVAERSLRPRYWRVQQDSGTGV